MNKLTTVRQALTGNPNIMVVAVEERNYLPGKYGYFSHTVNFLVAPVTGTFDAEELQAIMMSLVPGLETTQKDDFSGGGRRAGLRFGKLYFDESIGKRTTHGEIALSDPDLFTAEGFTPDGKMIIDRTEQLLRRTWVSVYPNVAIAALAAEKNKFRYDMSADELKHYK